MASPFLRPVLLLGLTGLLMCPPSASAEEQVLGYTEPYRIARMSFAEPGVLVERPVKVGDVVKEEQILARVDFQVLEEEMKIAEEQLRIREMRFSIISDLHRDGHAPLEEFEKAKADLNIQRHQIDRIKAQIENRTLRSPFDGTISEAKKEVSEGVEGSNTHVLTVVQTDKLQVNLHLDPEVATQFKPDDRVDLILGDGEKVSGVVEFISPVIDAASNTMHLKVVLDNPEQKLRSGVRSLLAGASAGGSKPALPKDPDFIPVEGN